MIYQIWTNNQTGGSSRDFLCGHYEFILIANTAIFNSCHERLKLHKLMLLCIYFTHSLTHSRLMIRLAHSVTLISVHIYYFVPSNIYMNEISPIIMYLCNKKEQVNNNKLTKPTPIWLTHKLLQMVRVGGGVAEACADHFEKW